MKKKWEDPFGILGLAKFDQLHLDFHRPEKFIEI